ncbi:MAG TPA: 50S ribosomal protein L17 [Syntrophales bacterium]|mgnify:CR=1 FL=1|jgi:large subunit ribosomal protein L17|nr:50S ribosomal protein L17 [Syntrophales bacterium]
MRHRKLTTKLGRTSSHRKAMFRNMVTSFLKYEKIETTDIKAKELRRIAEKMVTLGKRGDLHARRQALAYVRDRDVVEKLFEQISLRFKDRRGGYTRIVKTGFRTGDNAPMALIEFVGEEKEKAQKAKKASKSRQKAS